MARQCRWAILLLVAHFFSNSFAQRNRTVDDSDPSIVYNGRWEVPTGSPLDLGGDHHLSDDVNANAQFTFTGVAVYFMAPLWPYAVGSQVQLDNQPPVALNLAEPNPTVSTDQETVRSAVVWSSGPITNGVHTLTVTKNPNLPYIVVDAIIYTELDPPPTSSSSSSTSTSSTSASLASTSGSSSSTSANSPSTTNTSGGGSSNSSSSNRVLPIALGAALGALGIFIVGVAIWFCCRRRKRPKSEAWTISGASNHESAPLQGPLVPQQSTASSSQVMYDHWQQQQPYGAGSHAASDSWSGSSPQMSAVGVPLLAHAQTPNQQVDSTQPSQDFNPWSSITGPGQQQPQQMSYTQQQVPYGQQQPDFQASPFYAPTTLSTITEKSTPGTMNSNRLPQASPHVSYPSAEFGYYSPPQGTVDSGARLSYAGELPPGAATGRNPSASSGQLRSLGSSSTGTKGGPPGKLRAEQDSPLVAVNRAEDDSEGSRPPAYTV
ncbi:hypothetical protein D9756_000050 [Leucocoprinus leucothites]|uniref:Transmembrane protein n=1 Tax=Leucocoprinus leucothites TaxID=201217 RepID=A0A8H5GE69_9AGAR|nr:hypothetical protein D9756_000050 [Leucoagaricus leucothites]